MQKLQPILWLYKYWETLQCKLMFYLENMVKAEQNCIIQSVIQFSNFENSVPMPVNFLENIRKMKILKKKEKNRGNIHFISIFLKKRITGEEMLARNELNESSKITTGKLHCIVYTIIIFGKANLISQINTQYLPDFPCTCDKICICVILENL